MKELCKSSGNRLICYVDSLERTPINREPFELLKEKSIRFGMIDFYIWLQYMSTSDSLRYIHGKLIHYRHFLKPDVSTFFRETIDF